ncbi:hypothetical protein J437_LFUL000993, partial [Ladona fulva]
MNLELMSLTTVPYPFFQYFPLSGRVETSILNRLFYFTFPYTSSNQDAFLPHRYSPTRLIIFQGHTVDSMINKSQSNATSLNPSILLIFENLNTAISSEVPQVNVLGPYLFTFYVDDLCTLFRITKIRSLLFADDC